MSAIPEAKTLDKIIMMGDRVLIRPKSQTDRTKAGLYLPPGVKEKEEIHVGYVIKVGPGYPIPAITDYDEPWREKSDQIKYVPLQPRVGDLAIFLQKNGYDIEIKGQKYIVVPHGAILMLYRDEDLFN